MKNKKYQLSLLLLMIANTLFAQKTFTLSSKTIGGQATVTQEFNGFGCTGKNESPQLSWENAPEGTKSFAVTIYDKDAPTGSGWWHWLVFDIPTDINELVSNAGNVSLKLAPENSVQSITNYGVSGYGGPCPPKGHGLHQYVLTVYALKTEKLGLKSTTNPAIVGYNINANTIAKASLVMYYEK
ncbi:hypothetical protein FHR24_000624 [Wenyingzhuangia heitensis]|uniref:Phospholipid-binding protein, PBP family n=1 Tax=Wenyingzhuangia heitensis TaxID=1487859 RepID=A0ABX0U8U3_9FLAO|nr:YbhB/YbcL family Raf kinase inhibitor-like protein [Wenyingzhuangia heitensis]NIJ44185.1 hypothetical protein [Wenyingzhuangia heitensis]